MKSANTVCRKYYSPRILSDLEHVCIKCFLLLHFLLSFKIPNYWTNQMPNQTNTAILRLKLQCYFDNAIWYLKLQ